MYPGGGGSFSCSTTMSVMGVKWAVDTVGRGGKANSSCARMALVTASRRAWLTTPPPSSPPAPPPPLAPVPLAAPAAAAVALLPVPEVDAPVLPPPIVPKIRCMGCSTEVRRAEAVTPRGAWVLDTGGGTVTFTLVLGAPTRAMHWASQSEEVVTRARCITGSLPPLERDPRIEAPQLCVVVNSAWCTRDSSGGSMGDKKGSVFTLLLKFGRVGHITVSTPPPL